MKLICLIPILAAGFAIPCCAEENGVTALFASRQGFLWVARDSSLFRFDGTDMQKVNEYKPRGTIHELLEDQRGILWIGAEQGLTRLSGAAAITFTSASGLPGDTVRSLEEDYRGNIWIGTDSNIVAKYDGKTIERIPTGQQYEKNRIEDIHLDRSHQIWIATRAGLARWNGKSFDTLENNFVGSISEDSSGHLWLGSGYDLIRWKNGKIATISLPPPPARVRALPAISIVLVDRTDRIWIGTTTGLFQLRNEQLVRYEQEEIAGTQVHAMAESMDGTLWVGTGTGLHRITGN